MAESKGALIAKTVQKHAGRAKEKVSERALLSCFPLTPLSLSLIGSNRSLARSLARRRKSSRVSRARTRARSSNRFFSFRGDKD